MRQDEIDAVNEAVELIKAQEFWLSKNTPPMEFNEDADKTVTLYYDDVKDIYSCYLVFQKQLLYLQRLLDREIKLTNKSYGVKIGGVFSEEALIDAINLIKNNEHNVSNQETRR